MTASGVAATFGVAFLAFGLATLAVGVSFTAFGVEVPFEAFGVLLNLRFNLSFLLGSTAYDS